MRRLAAALVLSVLGAGQGHGEPLRVFAAASLTDAFREIAAAYERAHPGERVELNLAGSQVLRTQIEHGAQADVFASADLEHAASLRQAGLLLPFEVFARNRLVLVVPSGSERVGRLEELATPGVKLVLAAHEVPAGRYAEQVLTRADLTRRVEPNIASREVSVRAVLAKVALGEADAGLVYATDVATTDRVTAIEIPERQNVVAEYGIGVVSRSAAGERAHRFVSLVLGSDGQGTLRRFGFTR